jgi:hypothetical protein
MVAPGERASLDQALAVYAEAMVAGGMVAVLGDSSSGVGSLVLRLGARAVLEWDPDPVRARAQAEMAPRGLTVRPLAREDLVRRDFDLAIVPDLTLFDDPAGLLSDVRSIVGERGVALVAAPNHDAPGASERASLDYYELFEAVAAEFDFVRMVAELPFRAVALVELGEDTTDEGVTGVSVDTQIGDSGATPDAFLALASQRDVRLDPYAIVQLPAPREVPEAAEPPPSGDGTRVVGEDYVAIAELQARASDLEAVLAERDQRIALLTAQVEEMRAAADAGRMAAAEELDELIARVDRAEQRAAEKDRMVEALENAGTGDEHDAIEARLRERAQVIRELETELARRDRLVRDLAGALEDASHGEAGASDDTERVAMRRQLDAMALDLARRDGEAQAALWRNQELERRLAIAEQAAVPAAAKAPGASPPGVEGGDADTRLAAALDELDALRSALVQEHEARVRAEGGAPTPAPEQR